MIRQRVVVALAALCCVLASRWSPALAEEEVDLQVGSTAPVFKALDQDGKLWKSSDVMGKKVLVVYFYPAAHTGGCTKQACGFRDNLGDLQAQDVEVVGVSGDEPLNLMLFRKDQHLTFTLLADVDGRIAKQFGVPLGPGGEIEREFEGKSYVLKRGVTPKRWTFLIDKQGKIAWKNTEVNAAEDGKSILAVIQKQQAAALAP